ncbi:hypothetical protein [Vibrio parahaemolyticus]|uniref:hypothetical protein n=1 Tax=Vibrio parahaemolyticus TaxID=670 RepID=UPI0004A3D31C|nr:hypothetical protein [Vibrio parahaemolyticus]EJG2157361.1 hypothetical protein [Vibrio parahaemolyticus]HBC3572966.1 hypothetical protein [Vibrio parahaemolyticus]HCE4852691.1 hypothetical protein [Vibrio parahaemolyticus]HCG7714660.1 hypothetical protein [Vibrio parahaemolyticus]HCM0641499.1 hypothetical protein [Vibrio parahaemolyticus]
MSKFRETIKQAMRIATSILITSATTIVFKEKLIALITDNQISSTVLFSIALSAIVMTSYFISTKLFRTTTTLSQVYCNTSLYKKGE